MEYGELDVLLSRELARADALRERGNACASVKDWVGAHDLYSQALAVAPALPQALGQGRLWRLRLVLFSNRALMALNLGWLLACLIDCSSSIAENCRGDAKAYWRPGGHPRGVTDFAPWVDVRLLCKALVRRASAWAALGARGLARDDLRQALLFQPGHTAAVAALELLSAPAAATCCGDGWLRLPEGPQLRLARHLALGDLMSLRCASTDLAALLRRGEAWEAQLRGCLGPLRWHRGAAGDEDLIPLLPSRLPRCLGRLESLPPIVLDVGEGYLKVGFAGGSAPEATLAHLALMSQVAVISQGRFVCDSDHLFDFFKVAVADLLHVSLARHGVLLCTNAPESHEGNLVASAVLSELGAPRVHRVHGAALALLAHGLDTGIVLDIGLGICRAVPVVRGVVLHDAIVRQHLGAANCTNYLLEVFRSSEHLHPPDGSMSGFQLMMMLKSTKEDHGYVAAGDGELAGAPDTEVPYLSAAFRRRVTLGRELAVVGEMFFNPTYTGPQHSFFGTHSEPPTMGLHQMVWRALSRCPPDVREALCAGVVLTGGTSGLRGMHERLRSELGRPPAGELAHLRPTLLPALREAAWVGGSLLAAREWLRGEMAAEPGSGPPAPRPAAAWRLCSGSQVVTSAGADAT